MQITIITGASRGLGAAFAQLLKSEKTQTIGLARSQVKDCDQTLTADLSEGLEQTWQRLEAMIGGATHISLINNAATLYPVGALAKGELAEWEQAMKLNVTAPIWLTTQLIQKTSAAIRVLNISSGAANKPYAGWLSYCTTKAALRMAAANIAADCAAFPELASRDIALLEYEPGVLDTDMQAAVRQSSPDDFPNVDKFQSMKDDGELVAPDASAKQVLPFVMFQEAERFAVRRYQSS